jgi:hypothetical protein
MIILDILRYNNGGNREEKEFPVSKTTNVVETKNSSGAIETVTFIGQFSDLLMFRTTPYVLERSKKGAEYVIAIRRDGEDKTENHLRFHTNEDVVVDGVIFRHRFPSQK